MVIGSLVAGEQYMFTVAAATSAGTGPFSSPILETVTDGKFIVLALPACKKSSIKSTFLT